MNAMVSNTAFATAMGEALVEGIANASEATKRKVNVLTPFEAGELDQGSVVKITEALRAALPTIEGETNEAYTLRFDPVRIAYVQGHMRKALNVKKETAVLVFDMPSHKDGAETDKDGRTRRTLVQQAAYNNATVAWGRAIARAEIKTADKGKTGRKARVPGEGDAPKGEAIKDAPVTVEALHVPTCETIETIETHMAALAAHCTAFHDKNAKFFTGDKGMVYRDLLAAFAATVKKEQANVTIEGEVVPATVVTKPKGKGKGKGAK
jgi:hypothetical protein